MGALNLGIMWRIGNGVQISLLDDPWIPRPKTFRPITTPNVANRNWLVNELLIDETWSGMMISFVTSSAGVERPVFVSCPGTLRHRKRLLVYHPLVESNQWFPRRIIAGAHAEDPRKTTPTRWTKPPLAVLKLNVDAACFNSSGFFGVGGLIQNPDGLVLGSFAQRIEGNPEPIVPPHT
ncbi:hypothetical protein PanWU01x14_230700 [Parasponia andersonii]|uniref:RNase H type-1 domain-containing protein n=1 Tax=Parasponia andersonii TaxID=3476 RepID=A0A2P5BKI8_PARAD|nr:hypothetical protein PanWU01x14_230700 [Parasponia andersonii]